MLRRTEAARVPRLPTCSGGGWTTFPRRHRKGRAEAVLAAALVPPPCSRGEVNKPRAGCRLRGGRGGHGWGGGERAEPGPSWPARPPHMSRGVVGL